MINYYSDWLLPAAEMPAGKSRPYTKGRQRAKEAAKRHRRNKAAKKARRAQRRRK